MVRIYTGQEAGLDQRLAFFEKDSINWGNYEWGPFFTLLLKLKEQNKAMFLESDGDNDLDFLREKKAENVFAFIRRRENNQVLNIVNLSAKPVDLKMTKSNIAGDYTELFTAEKISIKKELSVHLEPWGYKVYVQ